MVETRCRSQATIRNYLWGLRAFFAWCEAKDKDFVAAGLLHFQAKPVIRARDITVFFLEQVDRQSLRHSAVNGYSAFLKFMRQKANDDYQVLCCPPTAANGFEACPYSEAIENIRVMHDLCAKCILQSNEVNKNVSAQNARRQTEEHAFRCDPKFQLLVIIKSFLTCDYVVDLNARLTTGGEMLGDTLLSPVFVRNFLMLRLLLTGALPKVRGDPPIHAQGVYEQRGLLRQRRKKLLRCVMRQPQDAPASCKYLRR